MILGMSMKNAALLEQSCCQQIYFCRQNILVRYSTFQIIFFRCVSPFRAFFYLSTKLVSNSKIQKILPIMLLKIRKNFNLSEEFCTKIRKAPSKQLGKTTSFEANEKLVVSPFCLWVTCLHSIFWK